MYKQFQAYNLHYMSKTLVKNITYTVKNHGKFQIFVFDFHIFAYIF